MHKLPPESEADLVFMTNLLRWGDTVSIVGAIILAILLLITWWL